ncbi:phosphoenolpyruvate--protein phosphotransferase, partial [Pseudomonas gingeri]|uniref:phosphoenolpyruvate-utilizing N-terminal domain-containing protein n=1 Tax=Pseudomonas gingeri TaxID=117681 RepID=UPI00181EEE84
AEDKHHGPPIRPTTAAPLAEAGVLHGVGAAPGLASGPIARLQAIQLPPDTGGHSADDQLQALDIALEKVRGEIYYTLQQAHRRQDHAEQAIFNAHLALLEDPTLLNAASQAIEQGS